MRSVTLAAEHTAALTLREGFVRRVRPGRGEGPVRTIRAAVNRRSSIGESRRLYLLLWGLAGLGVVVCGGVAGHRVAGGDLHRGQHGRQHLT